MMTMTMIIMMMTIVMMMMAMIMIMMNMVYDIDDVCFSCFYMSLINKDALTMWLIASHIWSICIGL